jgi:hypothetical protein
MKMSLWKNEWVVTKLSEKRNELLRWLECEWKGRTSEEVGDRIIELVRKGMSVDLISASIEIGECDVNLNWVG